MADSPVPGKIVALDKQIRDGDEFTLKRAKAHCAANTKQAMEPFQDLVAKHERLLCGPDGKDGLLTDVHDNGKQISVLARRVEAMEQLANNAISNLVDELRSETTRTGRTPRDGTVPPVSSGSAFTITLPKKIPLPVLVGLLLGGPSAMTALVGLWTSTPQEAVDVQAKAVATMQEQTQGALKAAEEAKAAAIASAQEAAAKERDAERRQRELEHRERQLARREAAQRGDPPAGPAVEPAAESE